MASAAAVGVVGMKALRRDINKQTTSTSSALYQAIRQAGREAAEPVAGLTRSVLPQDTGRLAGDVRVTATRTGAAVRMGRASIRYAGWVEFGGTRRAPHVSTRAYDPRGRYLFPAAVRLAPESARLYAAALQRVLSSSSIWTNKTTNSGEVHD